MPRPSARFVAVAFASLALAAVAPPATAGQPLAILRVYSGTLTGSEGLAVLRMTGTAEALGRFSSYGELVLTPGDEDGTLNGVGVIAFTAANGDRLVGVIALQIDEVGGVTAAIHWRDDVTFSDETTVASSGRFVERRPPGLTIMKTNADTQGSIAQNLK